MNDKVHPIFRTLVDRVIAPKDTGTNATMPKHHWLHNVIIAAGITSEQAESEAERLTRWFNAGEPVWIAADSLRILFRERAIHERADDEFSAMRSCVKAALKRDNDE